MTLGHVPLGHRNHPNGHLNEWEFRVAAIQTYLSQMRDSSDRDEESMPLGFRWWKSGFSCPMSRGPRIAKLGHPASGRLTPWEMGTAGHRPTHKKGGSPSGSAASHSKRHNERRHPVHCFEAELLSHPVQAAKAMIDRDNVSVTCAT